MEKEQALLELEVILKELTSTRIGRRAFLASVPALLTACASGEKTRYREGDNTGQQTTMTVEDEKRLTEEALQEMKKDYPPLNNPGLQSYITDLGNKVATRNNLEGSPYNYNFTVIDVDQVNAFALPAGTIFVTAPLIEMAESEAELAGVVGHEIGHVVARHTAERMDAARRAQGRSWIYGVGGGILGGVFGYGVGRAACRSNDRDCLRRAAELGAMAGAGGGLLVQKYKFMANSREDEMEADRIGFRTSVASGYHKDHVGNFYEKLLMMEQQSRGSSNPVLARMADAMSTHPPSRERVTQMKKLASSEPTRPNAVVTTKAFESAKKEVIRIRKSRS